MPNCRDIINNAIKESYIKFSEIGSVDIELINLWLSQSLNNFYHNHDVSGFIYDSQKELESKVTGEEVLDYICENYVEVISVQEDITDEFKLAIKKTLDINGNESAKIAAKKFITDVDFSGFVAYNDEKLKSYSSQGLISIMTTSLVKSITNGEKSINVKQSSPSIKDKIFSYELFVCSNNKAHDISKVVDSMEAIRSGKIKKVSDQEAEVDII